MNNQETILVTGATGAIGAYIALDLKYRGFNVIASGKRKNDNEFFSDHGIKYISIDSAHRQDFRKLDSYSIDTIVHLGGMMPASMRGYHPDQYVESIVTGTLNLLEYMKNACISKIIFGQSRADSNYLMDKVGAIPSDIEKRFPLVGDHAIYAICKNAAVDIIEHFYHQYNIKRFILRLPTIYAYHPNPYFYVDGKSKPVAYKLLINKAINGEEIEVWGNPQRSKEITSVRDLEQAIYLAIKSDLDGGVYNIGRGVGVSLDEQIKGIVEVFTKDKRSNIVYRPDKPDARQFVHDIAKTTRELGYEPLYDYVSLLEDYKKEMDQQRFRKLWGSEEDYEKDR